MRRNPCDGNLRGCSNIKKLAQIKRNKKRSWLWNFFREAGRLSRKKSTISDTLLKKVNSNSLFLLNDSSETLHLLNFLHRKYKIIYNNDIFV